MNPPREYSKDNFLLEKDTIWVEFLYTIPQVETHLGHEHKKRGSWHIWTLRIETLNDLPPQNMLADLPTTLEVTREWHNKGFKKSASSSALPLPILAWKWSLPFRSFWRFPSWSTGDNPGSKWRTSLSIVRRSCRVAATKDLSARPWHAWWPYLWIPLFQFQRPWSWNWSRPNQSWNHSHWDTRHEEPSAKWQEKAFIKRCLEQTWIHNWRQLNWKLFGGDIFRENWFFQWLSTKSFSLWLLLK